MASHVNIAVTDGGIQNNTWPTEHINFRETALCHKHSHEKKHFVCIILEHINTQNTFLTFGCSPCVIIQ